MRYSIEPCHPLGFWGRHIAQEIHNSDFSGPHATVRFLELNTLAQIDTSVENGARTAAKLLRHENITVAFLLDDLFASSELMTLLPPERVAEMLADAWARNAVDAGMPIKCTVVSERSLTATALAIVDDQDIDEQAVSLVAKRYQGVKIEVPTQAQTYIGEVVPSCPLLAAVWQMWRLGRPIPNGVQVQWWGDPHEDADRALTTLHTSLMPVEVAAGVILDACDAETLERIGYLFLPDHW